MRGIPKKYTDYADKVLKGKITACNYVKLACQRYLNLLKKKEYYLDTQDVDRVVNFISKLKHFTGKDYGKPFILSNWQFFIICHIYGIKRRSDNLRVTRTAYIEVSRKGGKTATVAALTLYHLIADREHNASVVLAANSAKQAGLCFDMASKYLKGIDPDNKWFKRYRDTIKFDATDSSLHIVAADASKLDGLNCSMYVVDELHEAPNGDVWRVLETSQGARQQPLAIAITTAGFNLSSFCYEMRKSNVSVLEGKSEDDSLFCCIWTLDQGDDVQDKKNWIKANPNLGVTNTYEFLEKQLKKAEINPTLRTSVITKLFNCWLSSSEVWIPERYINASQHEFDPPCDLAYLGVDLAASWDLTCVSVMWEYDTEFYFRNYYFLPSQTVAESVNGDLYHQWAQQGFLTLTEGNVTDYDYILKTIMEINKENTIQQVSYDKWNSTQFSISATEQGLNMVPYSMSIGSLNRPTKELARLIVSGKCHMFPNPIDNFCFSNVVIKRDWNENERPTKESKDDKIDGCLSMIMALGGWLTVNHWISDVTPLNFSDF